MNIFVKNILAAIVATVVWYAAHWLGGEPRLLDWFIFFCIEYTGVTVVMRNKTACVGRAALASTAKPTSATNGCTRG